MNLKDLQITVKIEASSIPEGGYSHIKIASVELNETGIGTIGEVATEIERIVADAKDKVLRKLSITQKILQLENERKLIAKDAS